MRSAAAESNNPRDLLGKRVSILFRLHDDPEYPQSEVVGVVQRVEGSGPESVIQVVKRDGTLVAVPVADVVALKVVEPRGSRAN